MLYVIQVTLMLYVIQVATLPKIVAKRWPGTGIDILVNNAGMSRNGASLFEGSVTSWVEMLSTNVLGTCMCTKVVLQVQ
jgi:NADP-dependent 3-hydroxy acid dehydrogenase YdfG